MEVVLISLVSGLGTGLVLAMNKLAEKALVDPALEHGLEPVRKWVTRGYDEQKDAEELRKILLDALDQLNESYPAGSTERLLATLHLTGLNEDQHAALAAAAIEMARFDPAMIPVDLLSSLRLEENNRNLLARFLFRLRERLAKSEKYRDIISYTNDLDRQNQLSGLVQSILDLQYQNTRLVSLQEALAADRHLTPDDQLALKEYLGWARQRWSSLMLPLIRKRSGDIVRANLKEVFVPLQMRDMAAEEKLHQRVAQTSGKKPAAGDSEEQAPPIGLGELISRYPRFLLLGTPGCGKTTLLHRAALAFAEGRADPDLGWQGKPLLPVFTRLRNFGAFLAQHKAHYPNPCPGAIVAFLENQIRDGERKFLSANFFDRRLQEGGCLVLLDGLDEVSENRSEVAQHISEFINAYGAFPGNRFGLSSRPRGYESVERQLRPARLAAAEVRPLDEQGIDALVHNLFVLIEPDPNQREKDTRDLVDSLLARPDLTEIASTPLFCSALVQVYKYHSAHLPERRVDVLDEIVILLLGFWRSQQAVADAERLAAEDGTGKPRRLEEAVNLKRQRLSFLASQMQEKRIVSIRKSEAVDLLAGYLKDRERVKDEESCLQWAEEFLVNSHEFSGMLVEHEPGTYSFLHKAFLEFLAAAWLVNRSLVVSTAMERLEDDWWEPVILLAGAHPALAENFRSELVTQVLEKAAVAEDPPGQAHHLVLAGKLALDMKETLPGPERECVEERLLDGMHGPRLTAGLRAQVGAALGRLGDPRPEAATIEGMAFCFIPPGPFTMGEGYTRKTIDLPPFWLAQFPVTNAQYQAFIDAGGYRAARYWSEAEQAGRWKDGRVKGRYGDEARSRPVRYRDPFGVSNHPVVGVSWYEALAFTRWLDELAHARGWLTEDWQVSLPQEAAWEKAARGGQRICFPRVCALNAVPVGLPQGEMLINPFPEREYPWDGDFNPEKANTSEAGIRATSAVGCFPAGASPYGVQDLSGNVWEWQENWYDQDQAGKVLRGGSWDYFQGYARCAYRYRDIPDGRNINFGFRCSLSPSS